MKYFLIFSQMRQIGDFFIYIFKFKYEEKKIKRILENYEINKNE